MHDLAITFGVPDEAVVIEEAPLHTLENASFTLPLLEEQGISRYPRHIAISSATDVSDV